LECLKVFWVLGYIAIHHSTIQLAERETKNHQ